MTKPMAVAYLFHKGRQARRNAVLKGDSPREFFLGALELEARGHNVAMIEIDLEKAPGIIGGVINKILHRGWLPEKMDGSAVEEVFRVLPEVNRYDVVVGTTSGIGFSLAMFRRVGLLRPPVVAIHCGILNNPYNWIRTRLTSSMLAIVHTMLYGEGEFMPLQRMKLGVQDRMSINSFGVDTEFWSPDNNVKREGFVLSIGNDGRRDFSTLIHAAPHVDALIRIITSRPTPQTLPDNVTITKGSWHSQTLSDKELRELYRRAACVVVPLVESYQPSGQSVTLQAMACACPVILTRTDGLWLKESLDDGRLLRLVQPGNVVDLADAINRILADSPSAIAMGKAAREFVCREASCTGYADRTETLLRRIISENN